MKKECARPVLVLVNRLECRPLVGVYGEDAKNPKVFELEHKELRKVDLPFTL